jgi:glycine oxidase
MSGKMVDVVVVGAGITGCFSAYFLAKRGLSVALVEQSGVGNQASSRNPGGLNPLHGPGIPGPMSAFADHAFDLHLKNREAIAELSGRDIDLRRISRLELAFDDGESEGLKQAMRAYEAAEGFSAQWLDATELRAVEPRVGPECVGALLTEGNGMVDSHDYTVAVSKAAQKLGVQIIEGTVSDLKCEGSRVTAVVLDSGELPCGAVVLATGPWVAGPERWLSQPIPVRPLKGELLLATLSGPVFRHHITWKAIGLYSLPPNQEAPQIWLGGTQEQAEFNDQPTPEGQEAILDGMARLVPSIREAVTIKHVAGLRPVTPDGLPIVGLAPNWDNAYLATGAGPKGMLIGSAIGESVAGMIAQAPPSVPLEHLAPNRFDA